MHPYIQYACMLPLSIYEAETPLEVRYTYIGPSPIASQTFYIMRVLHVLTFSLVLLYVTIIKYMFVWTLTKINFIKIDFNVDYFA